MAGKPKRACYFCKPHKYDGTKARERRKGKQEAGQQLGDHLNEKKEKDQGK